MGLLTPFQSTLFLLFIALFYGGTLFHALRFSTTGQKRLVAVLLIVFVPLLGIFIYWLAVLIRPFAGRRMEAE